MTSNAAYAKERAEENSAVKISVDMPRGESSLLWPHRCTCCGDKAASENLKLSYSLVSGNRNISETRTTSWSAPVCSQCLRHYRCDSGKDVEPIQTTLVFLGFVTGIGLIALFRAGGPFPLFAGAAVPEFLPWVALIALLLLPVGLVGYLTDRWKKKRRDTLLPKWRLPQCTTTGAPVLFETWGNTHVFRFTNEDYAMEFLNAQRSDVNARREWKTKVFALVRNHLGQITTDCSVLIFAQDPHRWTSAQYRRWLPSADRDTRRFDTTGTTGGPLAAGEYYAVALQNWEMSHIDEWTALDRESLAELLKRVRPRGTKFSLHNGETKSIDLILPK